MPKSKKIKVPSGALASGALLGTLVNKVVSGNVKSVAITKNDGLVFELKGAASRNNTYTVDTDAPHYSGSVALLMMAYTQNEKVTVNHSGLGKTSGLAAASPQTVYQALAVGLGADPEVD